MNKKFTFFKLVKERSFRHILVWGFTLFLIVALVYYVRDEKEKFARLLTINPAHLVILVGISLILFVPRGLIRKLMAQRLGANLAFVDWYGLFMVTNLISLVVPARGDFIFSAFYLKEKYGLPITHFGSMVYGNAVLLAIVLSLEGCLGLLLLGINNNIWDQKIWNIVIIVGLGVIPFALVSRQVLKGENWFVSKLRTMIEGWEMLRSDFSLLFRLSGLTVLGTLIFSSWLYMSYYSLGFKVGIIPIFFAGVAIQMSFFFSLTPGNLGIREAMLGFISQSIGLGFTEGVAVTVLQRVVSLLVFIVVGGLFSLFILPTFSSSNEELNTPVTLKGQWDE